MPPALAAPWSPDAAAAPFTPGTPLTHWLRLLWNRAPPLHLDSEAPFIAGGALHLPACSHWQGHRAAAAHAAAHLVYSPPRFDADGLVPAARAVLALLEDARVEALAMRELPGLARLWRPLHRATPDDGVGFEALLGRLARALADPDYADPHPWVAKGRRLFYLDEGLGLPALRTPAELRAAAARLGHDIGQLRLPFNAKGYRPVPAYRDDHRWMWPADQLAPVQPPPAAAPGGAATPPDAPPPDAGAGADITVTRHPEWDRLIQRLRPDWCSVLEQHPAPPPPPATGTAAPPRSGAIALSRQLLGPLQAWLRAPPRRGRSADGELFDLDALVSWRLAQRLGRPGDARVYRSRQRQGGRSAVWLLVDQSASSAARTGLPRPDARQDAGPSLLQTASQSAAAVALALQTLGHACTVAAFSSNGRHAVRLALLKRPAEPADDSLAQRLQALRPGGSTRLGAVLRHAARRLGQSRGPGWVLLLSDGEPHDVDVHDPHYLVDDARHAVRAAARQAVRMACLTIGAPVAPAQGSTSDAQRIFGRRATQALPALAALPAGLRRLMR